LQIERIDAQLIDAATDFALQIENCKLNAQYTI